MIGKVVQMTMLNKDRSFRLLYGWIKKITSVEFIFYELICDLS